MKLKLTAWLMAALMCCVSIAGVAARPDIKEQEKFLAKTVPPTFGKWKVAADQVSQIVDPATDELLKKIYKEVLSRTYVNEAGDRIMLSMALSANQIGIQQAHLPEICYRAQGFTVSEAKDGELMTAYGPIDVRRLTTSMRTRDEPVTYWLTMGEQVVRTQWDKRRVQIRAFLTGESPGGLLFRISSIDKDSKGAFAKQEKFVADMMESVSPEARRKLGGLTAPI
jgi:EpsI family protein